MANEENLDKIQNEVDPRFGEVLFYWIMPEFHRHERGTAWYAIFLVVGAALILWAILTSNYIFALFLVLLGTYMIMQHFRDPENVPVVILETGVAIGDHYHTWDDLDDFSIIYDPPEVTKLYIDFVKTSHPVVSIDIPDEVDPNELREILSEFVDENLERDQELLTDHIRRMYKL